MASNVVLEEVTMKAEARSHNMDKLEEQVKHMAQCFEEACAAWRKDGDDLPKFKQDRDDDYKAVRFTEDDYPVKLVIEAGKELGWDIETKIGGGGTDGSILTHKGIPSIVVGVGMQDIHSTKEWIKIADMEDAARLAAKTVALHARGI
jgi:tripeptide aminopeptidase